MLPGAGGQKGHSGLVVTRMNSGHSSGSRVQSVDALRGLVMIIMVLDHTRDFVHSGAQSFFPEDLTRTTAAIFFTRWVTHICAPVFMFTAGLGAFLWLERGHAKRELARFLVIRGIWLIFLEVTVVRFSMTFNFDYSFVILEVIWALGWCMILLAGLAYLPLRVLAFLSIAMIALHNLCDGVNASQFGKFSWVWVVLHQPGGIRLGSHVILPAYSVVPWVAVMSAGFCFGRVLQLEAESRRKWMLRIGTALTLAFILIRALNLYGNPTRWVSQATPLFTMLSFLRVTKYPPSLDFLLMTLGPALLLLAWLERRQLASANPLLVFGRVPLFYFIVHLYAAHFVALVLAFMRYGKAPFLVETLPALGGARDMFPPDLGHPLWVVYAVWAAIVVMLYPVCSWFGRVKQRRTDWWLRYL